MDDFKNSTKTQYSMGGAAYAKGGSVKGAAKVAKVMGEFKKGDLHSGSKSGPKVTSRKQATAIAMSEARKAGAKMPQPVQKKSLGGVLEAVAPAVLGGIVGGGGLAGAVTGGLSGLLLQQLLKKKQSGQPMTTAEQQKLAQAQSPTAGAPVTKKTGGRINTAPGAVVARGNRMSAEEAGEDMLIDRRRAPTVEPDYSRLKNYSEPSTPRAKTPLQQRLMRRAVPAHQSEPVINRKSGGLAVMPKGKKC